MVFLVFIAALGIMLLTIAVANAVTPNDIYNGGYATGVLKQPIKQLSNTTVVTTNPRWAHFSSACRHGGIF